MRIRPVLPLILCLLLQSFAAASSLADQSDTRSVLTDGAAPDIDLWDLARWRTPLMKLYAERNFAPLWFSNGHISAAGSALLLQLNQVDRRGLWLADYDGARLAMLIGALARRADQARAIGRIDVALSVTAARLASDLRAGRVQPSQVGYDLDVPTSTLDVPAAVAQLASASERVENVLDGFEPSLRHYHLLKESLARYRALAAEKPALPQLLQLPRTRVRPGETYNGAPMLRVLLAKLGDMPAAQATGPSANDDAAFVMDPELVAGLTHFQMRHGLDADGVLGRATFRALTTPLSTRVQQIELSLERVRWLPPKLDSPPIIVNIPQFRLFAFRTTQDFAQDILQMNVIVGATFKGRRTPVFAADMRYVVLNPYWDVPRSILLKELLPDIQAKPGWVDAHGYEIVRGEGDDAAPLPASAQNIQLLARGSLRLRQKPGPENALGRMKFMFPNRHNVYLHDTPGRMLFSRSRRAFSHGCIRVADPMALLAHVLRDDPAWTQVRIAVALSGDKPIKIPLQAPIRVYILYGTALTTEAGDTLFFEDLYAQDAQLASLLQSRRLHAAASSARLQ